LTNYQCISLNRTKEFIQECFAHSISEGTLVHHTQAFASQMQLIVQEAKENILKSSVDHFDETGMIVEGKTQWINTSRTQ
ncbi:IS66 family transposase, partial [Bacillus cereus]|uniref:IS66 family transposase n=1 Tax=Bacillus cereus TaxID=1396 RepID=UPI0021123D1E|nr:transposase [Bacillus cereus]